MSRPRWRRNKTLAWRETRALAEKSASAFSIPRALRASRHELGANKSRNLPTEWVDPDDAPELTAEFFEKAMPMIGERVVTWEEFAQEARREGLPLNAENKVPVTIFYDADIIAAFESTGEGWKQRMNDALRDWVKTKLPR